MPVDKYPYLNICVTLMGVNSCKLRRKRINNKNCSVHVLMEEVVGSWMDSRLNGGTLRLNTLACYFFSPRLQSLPVEILCSRLVVEIFSPRQLHGHW